MSDPCLPLKRCLRPFSTGLLSFGLSISALLSIASPSMAQNGQVNVLGYHNDLARTGQNLNETLLKVSTVTPTTFGKLFSYPVDGQVYAQPLYLAGVTIANKGRHNVVFIETEHDTIYAFDADSNSGSNSLPLWQTSFLNAGAGVTSVAASDINCGQISPEIGMTATPAIDTVAGTIYVVAMTKETSNGSTNYVQRLHALDISTGLERTGSPVAINATYPGTGEGGSVDVFVPKNYKERSGLLLLNGLVYTTWASHCDIGTYHGWMMTYDAKTLSQVGVYNNTANGNEASFWASGAAPSVDANSNLFIISGNGTFNPVDRSGQPTTGAFDPVHSDLGDTVLRIATTNQTLIPTDYFAPFNQNALNGSDLDFGSSGALLLPDGVGSAAHSHLLVSAGKEGRIYLIDRDNMGHQAPTNGSSDTNIVQSMTGTINALFSTPAYFNGSVYFSAVNDFPKALSISNGLLSTVPTSTAPESFQYPGSVPSISASSATTDGIAWMIESAAGVLHAYDATNLASEIYNSNAAPGNRDSLDSAVKFSVPTITDGRVYVGTNATLTVYGLLAPPVAATDVSSSVAVTHVGTRYVRGTGHYIHSLTVTNTSSNAITGPISLVVDNLSDGVTLTNNNGVTTSYAAPSGSFYQSVPLSPSTSLSPGQSISISLEFATPTPQTVTYITRVLAGSGAL